ncbi:unnamed protein product [Adineta ricciae]|uniref:Uncharacterized protein n=1 Tax=Adineta ricciae TaxID=249248 RepID=A0A813WYU2_ADIRI|nr:unnamed protein product [Adineta ricciae]CAF1610406.1 unnamed protein product [Adineta ricciae]
MVDILYSLVDVNERFNRLALYFVYTHHHLNLVISPLVEHYSSSIDGQVLDRICRNVLPQISNNIYQLTVEPLSLERVLSSANYPYLHSLALVNFPSEILLPQLIGNTKLVRHLTDQITELHVESYINKDKSTNRRELDIFALIISVKGLTYYYDRQIVPLLRRMSNLEELSLFLTVLRFDSTFIDGKQLYNDFLSAMTRLQKFSFNIHTQLDNKETEIHLPSSNDLRESFFEIGYENVDAFGDINFVNNRADSHIFSLPYEFKQFYFMTSVFPGGKFDQVQMLAMFDRRPFEHRLFKIIARDLPFLRLLVVANREGQQIEDHSDECVTFSHLCKLTLGYSHSDYAKEFLCNENVALPRLTNLAITYQTLETVTNSFTHHQARRTCNRITKIHFPEPFVRSSNFHLCFPHL